MFCCAACANCIKTKVIASSAIAATTNLRILNSPQVVPRRASPRAMHAWQDSRMAVATRPSRTNFRNVSGKSSTGDYWGSPAEKQRFKFKRYQRLCRNYPGLNDRDRMPKRGRRRKRGRSMAMMQTDRTEIGLGGARGALRSGLRCGRRMKVRGAEQLHDDQQRERKPANAAHRRTAILSARCYQRISAIRFT